MTGSPARTPPPALLIDRARLARLHDTLLSWYDAHGRDLPWRRPDRTPWEVFVSEIMLQQTQVNRVEPIWRAWLAQWPTPAALAAEPVGEAIRAWGRLGYPRRAVRLHAAATAMVDRYDGAVPATEADLAGLPGVGGYTAAAVAAFAFGAPTAVVDTNIRRVQARLITAVGQAAPTLTAAELRLARTLLPDDPATASVWNVAVMELGALVCTARAPACEACPAAPECAWLVAGRPAYDGPTRRTQRWEGTDRQLRGAILQALRDATTPLTRGRLQRATWQRVVTPADADRFARCLDSLVADGLVEPLPRGRLALPGAEADIRPGPRTDPTSRVGRGTEHHAAHSSRGTAIGGAVPQAGSVIRRSHSETVQPCVSRDVDTHAGQGRSGVVGLLLAGAGPPMGTPKALVVDPDGRRWLDIAVVTLLAVTDESVVVLGAQAPAVAALLPHDPRIRRVVAADWTEGVGASLRAGLSALLRDGGAHNRAQAALVHLVDLPDVTAPVASRVLGEVGGDRFTALARATYDGRPGHPVLIGRRHWAPLVAGLRGDPAARDYLASHPVIPVACGDLTTSRDRDTRVDRPGSCGH